MKKTTFDPSDCTVFSSDDSPSVGPTTGVEPSSKIQHNLTSKTLPSSVALGIVPVIIHGSDQWKHLDIDWDSILTEITQVVLAEFEFDRDVEVNIKLTDDSEIQILNREFRGKDKPTNVLSFPGMTDEDLDYLPDDAHFHLGDIALAFETINREAEDQEKTLQNHVLHLTVHGLLHLLGFDHETDDEATEMETLEVDILAKKSIPNPYKE